MSVAAKNDAGPSTWDQVASNNNNSNNLAPLPSSPIVKQPNDVRPAGEFGEELHPELVCLQNKLNKFKRFKCKFFDKL
jgi:hypothetical protein